MRAASSTFLLLIGLLVSSTAGAQGPLPQQGPVLQRVPENVILVKGAWSSASDNVTPLPEGGKVSTDSYNSPYFGLTLPLPAGWIQKYEGPPPSDSGYYVLAQLRPADPSHEKARGTLLVAAQDMFFTTTHAAGPLELINYTRDHLQADYRIERPPSNVTIAGRDFVRFGYVSPVAGLHWMFFATQIRCHVVEFIFTSADTPLLENLTRNLGGLKSQPERPATEPVCIKGYVSAENILERVDPVLTENKYNQVPVRVIIDREGKVKHIHFLSAFPDQAKAITDALGRWKFKPYLQDGHPVEVETGILFGRTQASAATRRSPVE